MKRTVLFNIISIALFLVIISCNSNVQETEQKGTGTVEEGMYCMDWYIDSISKTPDYSLIMNGITQYLVNDSIILNNYGMNNTVKVTIDSALLFHGDLTFCCCFLIVQTPDDIRNDYIDNINARKKNGIWTFSEGMNFLYKRKQDSLGNYTSYTLDYLSRDVRLEFINDGFIKNKNCEIDWNYVEKWRE